MTKRSHLRYALLSFSIGIVCIAASILSSCVKEPAPVPSPAVTAEPVVDSSHVAVNHGLTVDQIAASSACAAYSWPHRGRLPGGAVKGIAETFVKSLCAKRSILTKAVGDTNHDALAIYHLQPTLPNVYALLMSSAAMESSGKYCEGRDTSAGAETSTTAESGIFQQSQNVMALDPSLKAIYDEYVAHPERCGLATFKEDVTCKASSIVGTGPGADFQRMMQLCPALATEQAALGLRVAVRHWGPARRGELTVNQDCVSMFSEIAKAAGCE